MMLNVKDLSLYQLKELDFALEEYIFKELGDEPFAPSFRKNPALFRKLIRELVLFKRELMKLFAQMFEHRHLLINYSHIQADEYDKYFYPNWDYYDNEVAKIIERHSKKTYELGVLSLLLSLGIATNLTAEDAQPDLLKHAIKMSKAISKTTKDRIIKQIKASVALNENREEFEQRLKRVLQNQYRGYLISEHEGLTAWSQARLDVAVENELKYKTLDGVQTDKSEICGQSIGETVPVNQPYSNGLMLTPFHLRCRCSDEFSNSKD